MSGCNETTGQAARCDYCRRPQAEVGPLLHGGGENPVKICRDCVAQARRVFDEQDRQRATKPERLATIPSPKQIVEYLDRSVVGQDHAKRTLAIAVSNHFVRLLDAWDRTSTDPIVADGGLREIQIEKSNVLLIGHSGSGKTHLARSLAEYLSVPFAVADATTLTEAGYVGEDVESVLHKLLVAADMDVQTAQRGIVFIDEIDKLRGGQASGTKDMRLGVQQAILKMIEGKMCSVPPGGGNRHPMETCIPFDTTNVLFVCGGAFVGLEDIIARRLGRDAFGFDKPTQEPRGEQAGLLCQVLPEDLERYGLILELLGRLPIIATLDQLGVEDLVRILQAPKNALIQQYQKLLKYRHADLEFSDGAVREIARIAHERGTGARGLRSVVEAVLEPVLFDTRPWLSYRITEETVRGGEPEMYWIGLPGFAPLRARVTRRAKG